MPNAYKNMWQLEGVGRVTLNTFFMASGEIKCKTGIIHKESWEKGKYMEWRRSELERDKE